MNSQAQELLERAFEFHEQHDWEQAEAFYLKTIQADPRQSIAYAQLGQLNVRKGKSEEARKYYEQAIELDGDNDQIHVGFGHFFLTQKQTDKALEHLEKALTINKNSPGAHLGIAVAYLQKDLPIEALKKYEEVLSLCPPLFSQHVFYRQASLYCRVGLLSLAIRHYEQALAENPFHNEARFELALCYESSGETNLALSHCRLLLKVESDPQELQKIRGTIARLELCNAKKE